MAFFSSFRVVLVYPIAFRSNYDKMNTRRKKRKIMSDSQVQEIVSLENPFIQLAPELVDHILRFLPDLPSLMAASGVCRLWRELVDLSNINHLHLDFDRIKISDVPIAIPKWSEALESLLPKVELTSLQVTLPEKQPTVRKEPGLHLPWPLQLFDCGAAVIRQEASLTSITHVSVSGPPSNPEFAFICRLLELCASVTHLNLSLNSDQFDLGLLKSALTNKRLIELNMNLSHLTGNCSSEHFAQLCQVLAPGTLKSLTLNTGELDASDHPYALIFDQLCMALHTNAGCLSALENLAIGSPSLDPSHAFGSRDINELLNVSNFPALVNDVLPKLKTIEFIITAAYPDEQEGSTQDWISLFSSFWTVSEKFNHPLQVSLSTSHCFVFRLLVCLKLVYGENMAPISFHLQITEEGWDCTKLQDMFGEDEEPPIEFHYKRLPPVGPTACTCEVCLTEYGLVKQQIINRLNGKASKGQVRVFSCQIPRLQVDLIDQFPGLSVSPVQNGSVKFKVDNKSAFSASVIQHNSLVFVNICAGCAMLPQPQL